MSWRSKERRRGAKFFNGREARHRRRSPRCDRPIHHSCPSILLVELLMPRRHSKEAYLRLPFHACISEPRSKAGRHRIWLRASLCHDCRCVRQSSKHVLEHSVRDHCLLTDNVQRLHRRVEYLLRAVIATEITRQAEKQPRLRVVTTSAQHFDPAQHTSVVFVNQLKGCRAALQGPPV
eukprot:4166802-Prymnesium_polylepis.1